MNFVSGNQKLNDMSEISIHQIPCPSCGHTSEFKRWDSINVDLNPEMREDAKSGAIFMWRCPHCGESFVVPYATLYHDMKRKMMVYYLPSRPEGGEGFNVRSGRSHFKMDGEYTYRFTYEIEDFMEKIAQLESGLDDRVIELLKLVMTGKNRPENVPANAELRFVSIVPNNSGNPNKLLFRINNGTQCSPDEQKVMMIPYEAYLNLDKEPMTRKMFEQDAEFPEVSQEYLRMVLGK